MKMLGLIGGVGPESTIKYYRLIIEYFQKELKTQDLPEILIESINMTEIIDKLIDKAQVPIISIIDEACKAIKEKGVSRVGLFGTRSTMTNGFYQKKAKEFGIEIFILLLR